MDLVTKITQVYKGERYLTLYFSQIEAVGYENLPIIIINDGRGSDESINRFNLSCR